MTRKEKRDKKTLTSITTIQTLLTDIALRATDKHDRRLAFMQLRQCCQYTLNDQKADIERLKAMPSQLRHADYFALVIRPRKQLSTIEQFMPNVREEASI